MTAPQRTPISLLQELCMQHCVTADYKLMSVEGAYHAPTFMYRVQVGDVVTTSTGASKKKAKHAAALTILQKLLTVEGGYPEGFESEGVKITAENLLEIISDPAATAVVEEEGQKNPVGELQELCMKRHWQPPYYETKVETGLPHDKKFTMECSVGSICELGTGKSKRLAKREAAKIMLEKIQAMDRGMKTEQDVVNNKMADLNLDDMNGKTTSKTETVESMYEKNIEEFLNELKSSHVPCLMALQEIDLSDENLDYMDLLRKIAAEQEFEITYLPIEQPGKSGNYNCVLKIKALPVAVCFGSGPTIEDAKVCCARNALNFIQLMCKA